MRLPSAPTDFVAVLTGSTLNMSRSDLDLAKRLRGTPQRPRRSLCNLELYR